MEPIHQRHNIRSDPQQSRTVDVPSYKDLLIEGDYVAKLRGFYRDGFDGLVRGEDAKVCAVSLGFDLGGWVVSDAAVAALTRDEIWVATLQHGQANWGDVGPETADANFHALEYGGELRSAYHTPSGVRFTVNTNTHLDPT